MKIIDSVYDFSKQFDFAPGFITRLQKVFTVLATEYDTYQTTQSIVLTSTDNIGSIYVDSTAGNVTVYLPTSPTGSRRRTVVKSVAANVVIIDAGSFLIKSAINPAGSATTWLNARWESLTFEPNPDKTGWVVVASQP